MWAARWIEIMTKYCEFPEEERGNGMVGGGQGQRKEQLR